MKTLNTNFLRKCIYIYIYNFRVKFFHTCTYLVTPALGKAVHPTSAIKIDGLWRNNKCVCSRRSNVVMSMGLLFVTRSLTSVTVWSSVSDSHIAWSCTRSFAKSRDKKRRAVSPSCLSVFPSLRMQQLCSYWKEIIRKFIFEYFSKTRQEISKSHLKRVKCTLVQKLRLYWGLTALRGVEV